jgi:hypothetical protein
MSRSAQNYTKSDFGFQVYLGFLGLVALGLGGVAYGFMQPTRLTNLGLAAYTPPAGVRALYPQPRSSKSEDEIMAAIFTPTRTAEREPAASTTGQANRPERKVSAQASDQRKSSKRAESRVRERQRDAITSYARDYSPNYGQNYGSNFGSNFGWNYAPNYAPNYARSPPYGFRRAW